jgi:CRP-like cAMP-binding protein
LEIKRKQEKMKEHFPNLKASPLFAGISDNELGSLMKCLGCTFRAYKRGENVYLAGDIAREIGLVACGRVRIVKDDFYGNQNIIAEVSEGGIFAEAAVCSGAGVLTVNVVAATDAEIMFFDFQRVIATCSSACIFHTLLIRNMLSVFARKNLLLAGKMEHITKRTTREKLLSYLTEQSQIRNSNAFEIPFNRQELADFLSVERSALSAEMSKLKANGVIAYHKNRFEIRPQAT